MTKKDKEFRTCVVTREKFLKKELFRWVLVEDKIYLDWRQQMPGRAIYTQMTKEVIEKFYLLKKLPSRQ